MLLLMEKQMEYSQIGIFSNWNDCNNSVKKYKNALYKKFNTKEEADNFIKVNEKNIDDINIIN